LSASLVSLIFSYSFIGSVSGQCDSDPNFLCGFNGNNSSVATFPWTSSSTIPYYYPAGPTSGALSSVYNPFFDPGCSSNTNILKFCGVPNPDFQSFDGWEFLHAHLGTPLKGVKHPSFTLYNKHTGILRVFTNLTTATVGQVALIKVGNLGTKKTSLLSAYEDGESHALDQFHRNQLTSPAVNNRNVQDAYRWVYADFKTVYDPCTCTFDTDLLFSVIIVDESSIDAQLSLLFNLNLEATLKGESKVAMGTGKDVVSSILGYGVDGTKYIKDLLGKGDEGSTIKAVTKVLPQIGAGLSIAKMIYSIANPAAPTTTVTKFDGQIRGTIKGAANGTFTGTISNVQYEQDWTIRTPGSSSLPFLAGQRTYYNEPLGVFHVLKAPAVKRKKLDWVSFIEEPETYYAYDREVREQLSCPSRIEYLQNPAAVVCLENLEASYFIKYADGQTEESESFPLSCFRDFHYTCKRGSTNNFKWRNGYVTHSYEDIVIQNIYVKLSGQIVPQNGSSISVRFAELYRVNSSYLPTIDISTNDDFASVTPSSSCGFAFYGSDYSVLAGICNGNAYKQSSGQFLAKKQEEEAKAAEDKAKGDLNVNISPNPVQNALLISYNLPKEESKVSIQVLNINGQVVATILPPTVQAIGEQTLTYNTSELVNGVYMIRVVADESSKVTKMVVAH
jgi:Secretion system C-terminal sorting domain